MGLVLISKKKKALRPKYTDAGSVSIGRMVNVFSRRLYTDAAVVWRRDFLSFIKLFKDLLLILFTFNLEYQDFVALWGFSLGGLMQRSFVEIAAPKLNNDTKTQRPVSCVL